MYYILYFQPTVNFLPNYRMPCLKTNNGSVLCMPSVYLAGVAKCGTTDLYKNLIKHPNVMQTIKEPQWWGAKRFQNQTRKYNYSFHLITN